MGVKVYYWKHTSENWGHASLGLSNGTHISWWPNRPINGQKKIGGQPGTAIAAITEWVDPIPNMTLAKDIQYEQDDEGEGSEPTEVIEFPSGSLDEGKIQTWWASFKTKNQYNGLRLNCATVVWKALKEGGCLKYVVDPKRWWWDPNSVLKVAKAIQQGIKDHHAVHVTLPEIPDNIQEYDFEEEL